MDGVIVADKPSAWTSHDVVNRIRRLAGTRKVGHLGTLDPMATGVLPLVVGRATRLAQFFSKSDKVYDATVRFGFATDTYDAEGKPAGPLLAFDLRADWLEREVSRFRGVIEQVPPPISAKKIGGKAAYKLVRENMPVNLAPVTVEIHELTILKVSPGECDLRVHCSPGTYIRSIAHELGIAFGCGAHLSRLRRLSSGGFDLSMARTLDELAHLQIQGRFAEAVIPCASLLPEFPNQLVDESTAGFIRQGRDFRTSPFRDGSGSRFVKAVTTEGDLVAIGEAKLPHLYHPILVL